MQQLSSVVSEIRETMHFHRVRARRHLLAMLALAIIVLFVALAFGGLVVTWMEKTAQLSATYSQIFKGAGDGLPVSAPDFTKIASEHTLGYIMLSGFVLLLFVAVGLLRYHVKRATINEDRLYHLLKVSSFEGSESSLPELAQQSLLDLRENVLAASADSEAHAGLAVIEKALQALVDSVAHLKKRG